MWKKLRGMAESGSYKTSLVVTGAVKRSQLWLIATQRKEKLVILTSVETLVGGISLLAGWYGMDVDRRRSDPAFNLQNLRWLPRPFFLKVFLQWGHATWSGSRGVSNVLVAAGCDASKKGVGEFFSQTILMNYLQYCSKLSSDYYFQLWPQVLTEQLASQEPSQQNQQLE